MYVYIIREHVVFIKIRIDIDKIIYNSYAKVRYVRLFRPLLQLTPHWKTP